MRVKLWDLPTRVCHWTLAGLVATACYTGFVGGNAMTWHGRAGVAIAGLLAFRIVWGLLGSTHARFASFVRGPAAIRAYLRGEWRGIGHNPLGAISVLAMLGLLAFQVGTGLFGNDDIAFDGPLYALVSKETSDFLTGLHHKGVWLVLTLIALHIGATMFYIHLRKEVLVRPMLTGWKDVPATEPPPHGGGLFAFLVAALIGGFAAHAAAGGLLPPPPPATATPVDAPNW